MRVDPVGSADIMFATNFEFLKLAFAEHGRSVDKMRICKLSDFFQEHLEPSLTRRGWLSRYNALLDEFPNVSGESCFSASSSALRFHTQCAVFTSLVDDD